MQVEHFDSSKLRELMNQHFDLDGIKSLCFDLHIDYDNLDQGPKKRRIESLIQNLSRQNRVPDLTALCRRQIPHVDWPQVARGDVFADNTPAAPESVIEKVNQPLVRLIRQLSEETKNLQTHRSLHPVSVKQFKDLSRRITDLGTVFVSITSNSEHCLYLIIESYLAVLQQENKSLQQAMGQVGLATMKAPFDDRAKQLVQSHLQRLGNTLDQLAYILESNDTRL